MKLASREGVYVKGLINSRDVLVGAGSPEPRRPLRSMAAISLNALHHGVERVRENFSCTRNSSRELN